MPRSISFPDLGRTVTVGDDVTDDGIEQVYGELSRQQSRSKQGVLRAEGMAAQTRADVLDAYENDPEMPVLMRSEFGRSVARGMAGIGGTAISAASMAMPGQASRQINAYGKELARMGDIESTAPRSFSEIQDVGDAAGYAGRLLAEQIPQLLLSGPVAGGLQAIGVGTKAAMLAAPVITTFPQEAGSIYQDITDETGQDGFRQRAVATGAGLLSAGLELGGGEARVLKNLAANGGLGSFRKAFQAVGGEALRGFRDEAVTEAGQESIGALSPYVAGGRLPTEQEFVNRVSEAAIAGGLTGAPMGGVSRAVSGAADSAYMAALTDAVSPEANQGGIYVKRDQDGNVMRDDRGRLIVGVRGGINSDEGLQPYRGGRIEEDRPAAFRANPNDIGSLSDANQIADARANATAQRRDLDIASGRNADQAREAEAQRQQAGERRLEQKAIGDQRRSRRDAVEEGLSLPQDSGRLEGDEPRIGQYPAEGFGTGVIPSVEEENRRAAVRASVAIRNRQAAEAARAARASATQVDEEEHPPANPPQVSVPTAAQAVVYDLRTFPPTVISLPADTGAPPTGGVQTGAPVLPSTGTQGQAPVTAPTPKVTPTETKAPAAVYQDGSAVKVGDYVRVNKLVGQSKIYGSVFEIKDGVPIIKITTIGKGQSGTAQTDKAGVRLGDAVPLPSKPGVFLTKETNKNELAAQAKQEKEDQKKSEIDGEQKLINQGAVDELYPRFADLIQRAAGRDRDAQVELNDLREELSATPEGRLRAIGLEAAVRVSNISASLAFQAQANGAFSYNDDVAGRDYLLEIKRWMRKSIETGESVSFSPSRAASTALQNAIKKRTVDKNTVSISSGTDLEGSESSPIEQIAAAETGVEAGNAPVGVTAAGSTSSTNLLKQFASNRQRVQNFKSFVATYIDQYGLAESIKKGVTKVFQQSVATIDRATSNTIDQISEEAVEVLQKTFDEEGSEGVIENIGNGTLFDASTKSSDTGNQSLTTGELTLEQAINTVLETEPQGSLLRSLAEKLLKAGVTARVVVLSDADFALLGAKDGATAFYDSNPDSNTIYVRQSAKSHDYLVMHEAIHAATVNALRTNVQFRNEIRNLRARAIGALGQDSYALQNHGSNFKDLAEFISEALSNSEFQAALKSIPDNKTESLWDRFKSLVSKLFGITKEQSTVFDRVFNLATDNFAPNTVAGEGGVLNAAPRISSDEKRQALLSVPGLQMDNVRAIERLAATQAQMIPAAAVTMIKAGTNRLQRRLAWMTRQAEASPSPASISSLIPANPTYADVEELAELSHGVDKVARDIERNFEKAEKRLVDLQEQFSNIPSLRSELNTAKGDLAAIKAVSESMLDDYNEYLKGRAALSGKLTAAEESAITAASEVVRRVRTESNNMRKAMEVIAEKVPAAFVAAATTNDDIANYVVSNKLLDGVVDQSTIDFLTTPSAGGRSPLQSFKRLIPAIKLIQTLKSDKSALNNTIDAYESAFAAVRGNKTRTVSPRMFAKAFSNTDQKKQELLDQVRLLNSQIDGTIKKLSDALDEADIYDTILRSPEYKEQVETAIKQLNILTGGHNEGGAEGNPTPRKLTFQVGIDSKNRFEINYTADPAENEKNKGTVLAALAAIENELQATDNPYEIFKLKWMQMKLARYSHQMTDAALGINPFDLVNRIRVWVPLLTPLIDRMFIFRQIPGAMGSQARLLAKVGMSMTSQIDAARKHPAYGEAAINSAVQDAIESHPGMDPQVWDKQVLNELFGANQERTGRNLRAGETTIFGHKITPEDVAAAKLQARFADSLYRVAKGAERGGIAMYFPTLVQETYTVSGQKRIRFRYAYAGGALTTPRSYDRGELETDPLKMSEAWRDSEVPNDPIATQAAREALLQDSNFLTRFALAHVVEMNSEYDRTSPFNDVYRQLADQYAKTGKYPTTLDELVDDINNAFPLPAPADRSLKIKAKLIGEIDTFTKAYRNDLIGAAANDPNAVLRTDAMSAVAFNNITSSANNFTKPRGAMIAPTNFYTYTLSSDSSRGSVAHGVMLPLRRKQIESMNNIQSALIALQKQMSEELSKAMGPRDYVTLLFLTGKKRVTTKQAYATYWQLSDLVKQMSNSIQVLKTTIEKPVLGSGQTTFFEDVMQLRRIALVAQVVAAIVNYSQAVMSGQFVPRTYLSGYKPRMIITESVVGAVKTAFSTAAYIASSNKPVASWLSAHRGTVMPIMRQFAEAVDQIQKMKVRARAEGFAADQLSLKEQAAIIRKIGSYSSPVEGFNDVKNIMSSGMDKVFSKWWFPRIALTIQNIPATADRAANILTMIQVDRALNDVMRSGSSIMENREKSGATGWDNWTDPANAVSEAEAAQAGWSKESLVRMRQAFSGLGGLEVVLHDYWKRVNAAKASGQNINDVPPIADEGFYMDVTREMLGLSNASMDSMRTDATRSRTVLSGIYNFIFTFTSWVNGWFSTLGTLVGVDRTRGTINTAAVSGLSIALLMVLLGMSGMWTNELRGMMYELVKGRPFPVIRMGDVARDPNLQSVAKLFGASIALMMPHAGESVANLLGSQTNRSSLTDLANLSQPLQLVKTFSDALMSGVKTGDWTGTFSQLVRSTFPGSDMVINRIPAVAARDATNDAGRVARVAAGPLELSDRSGGGGAQPTRFSNLIKRAEGELANGNQAKAQSLLNEAADEKVKQGNTDPWGAVKSAIQGRDVDQRTFGRKINEDERNGLTSRMSSSQREVYSKAKNNLTNLKGLVPEKGTRGGFERISSSSKSSRPETAIDRVSKKINKLQKGTRPKGLIAIDKKIKSLKPKKIRFAKASASSGTRLLRPTARVKGASGLLPSV